MSELAVFCGIQASGKSSFYDLFLRYTHARVSKDLMGSRTPKDPRMEREIRRLLEDGFSVVVDNTNVELEARARLVVLARACGTSPVSYFFPPDIVSCLERNEAREGKKKVPVSAVWWKYDRLVAPTWDEGYTRMYEVTLKTGGLSVCQLSSQADGHRDSKSSL